MTPFVAKQIVADVFVRDFDVHGDGVLVFGRPDYFIK